MSKVSPPKYAEKLLEWVLHDELAEEVLGDLEEQFYAHADRKGLRRAKRNYWYQTWNYLRPFALKPTKLTNHFSMYRHYFKLSWRALKRQRLYSSIKIGGFALGIAATIFIALFIQEEVSYDQHYKDQDRIFRMINVVDAPDEKSKWSHLQAPIKAVLDSDIPQIEQSARFIAFNWYNAGDNQFRPQGTTQSVYEKGFAYADPELLEILEVPFIYGNATTALAQPNSIVLSKEKADSYFPNQDPVGLQVILNEEEDNAYTIGGVMDIVANTHLQADFLLTLKGKEFWPGEQTSWDSWNYSTYVKLVPGADRQQVEQNLLAIRDTHMAATLSDNGGESAFDLQAHFRFLLQPVNEIYLTPAEELHDSLLHGDRKTVWLFGCVALFILLLACVNFINLSTAKSAMRAKEVGMLKVVGSFRSDLIRQFLAESVLFCVIAFGFALALVALLMPYFNILTGKTLELPWLDFWFLPGFGVLILLVGVISGIYPAFYLSAFRPAEVLKGTVTKGKKSSRLRSGLVVFQFATTIVLIICTVITYRQMDFILNKKLGFEKDRVVLLYGSNTLEEGQQALKDELKRLSHVEQATISEFIPITGATRDQNGFWLAGRRELDKSVGAQKWRVDEDYLQTMGMKLVQGRNFSEAFASDSSAVIINEAMAREFGLDDPLGAKIVNSFEPAYHVIGVVEDFHFESMKGEIRPLCLVLGGEGILMPLRLAGSDVASAMHAVEHVWDQFLPNQAIRYRFMDQEYAHMYDMVQRTSRVFTVFSVLAIIVACLGLFALSAFMVEQRSKEVSIRKVLGASLMQIFGLLTFNFLRLVVLSLVVAIPLGWYLMREWLDTFVYRVTITWDVYVLAGLIALAVALITISGESLKAGVDNPAKRLRSE
ncbi:ABC transporter permease [Marinoscillum furvescens]|uniref:Putative ABC transport system permease protein n=1 Tax=Marinoscillum furvescens DSM 4134 TaxID=1122208 RepID=A0A3D9L3J9_MARFU|nr:ABC transporter permease [Marinoscillum furvescens]RED99770.1 putative ABC transport system permease protein [Marinoscillum furvescens DSM 4134]